MYVKRGKQRFTRQGQQCHWLRQLRFQIPTTNSMLRQVPVQSRSSCQQPVNRGSLETYSAIGSSRPHFDLGISYGLQVQQLLEPHNICRREEVIEKQGSGTAILVSCASRV